MDVEICADSEEKDERFWEPVTFKMRVKTLQEMRLLFHVMNANNVWEPLKKEAMNKAYSEHVATYFEGDGWNPIEDEIVRQGFKV